MSGPLRLIHAVLGAAISIAGVTGQMASFGHSGAGCPPAAAPRLGLLGWPVPGSTTSLTLDALPPGTLAAVAIIGLSPANVPLDAIGAPGCSLLVGNVVTTPTMSLSVPSATLPLPIPAGPAVIGATLQAQGVALDGPLTSPSLLASDRGTMVVGRTNANVILIVSDDQRCDAIGALGGAIQTPNIDRLVNSGFRFINTYNMGSSGGAVCRPSRAMFLTGRNLSAVWGNTDIGSVPTIPSTLRAAGYNTFGTGKWHNGQSSFVLGFDEGDDIYFGGCISCSSTSNHLNTTAKSKSYTASLSRLTGGVITSGITENGVHVSERFADEVVNFIGRQSAGTPWFAYLSFTASHDPRTSPPAWDNLYRNASGVSTVALPADFATTPPADPSAFDGDIRDESLLDTIGGHTAANVKEELADYYGMITHMDAQIGKVLDEALRFEGLDPNVADVGDLRNTVIVFTSDHGLAIGSHGLMGKQNPFEHSIRAVPLTFAGAIGGIPIPHGSSDAFAYLSDIFPTLAQLLGMPTPASVQAESLADVIVGARASVRDSVYNAYKSLSRAVREGDWKLMYYPGLHKVQLFDLATDPHEINDLSGNPANWPRIDTLAAKMRQLESQLNAAGSGSIPADFFGGPQITWQPPQNVSSIGDLSNLPVVLAWNGGASAVTVAGIQFTPSSLGSDYVGTLVGSSTGDPGYDGLLDTMTYGGGTSTSVQLLGLVPGRQYQLQVWYTDLRTSTSVDGRVMTFRSPASRVAVAGESTPPPTTSVDVTGNILGVDPAWFLGQYAKGTFVATETTLSLRMSTNGFANAHYNGLLVQEVPSGP